MVVFCLLLSPTWNRTSSLVCSTCRQLAQWVSFETEFITVMLCVCDMHEILEILMRGSCDMVKNKKGGGILFLNSATHECVHYYMR
jgi:hypothetical protein